MGHLRPLIKKIIQNCGYDLKRFHPKDNEFYQLLLVLNQLQIDVLLDVGANTGQFAKSLRNIGYTNYIISFEPLNDVHTKLKNIASSDHKWRVFPRCAIGNMDGEININISGNSVSSSILPMLDTHISSAPHSKYVGEEKTPIHKLDSILNDLNLENKKYFLKIDTQGYEWNILQGAQNLLENAQGVLCELSLVPLHEGQHLWFEMINYLNDRGFSLWALQNGFTDSKNGRTLQVDAIFIKNKSLEVIQ